MANPEHLKILKQGVDVWNEWRVENPGIKPDLSSIDLSHSNFQSTNLRCADFTGSDLQYANLKNTELLKARLVDVNLENADLSNAFVEYADLSNSYMYEVYFECTNLYAAKLNSAMLIAARIISSKIDEADFSNCEIGDTIFSNVDLSTTKGLESVKQSLPSSIGIDTIYKSKGKIPESFLRGAGVPKILIDNIRYLVDENPIEYYRCFLSFGEPDKEFATKLRSDLVNAGISVYFWPEDHKDGVKTQKEIHEKIYDCDKLLIVCSQESLARPPVVREIELALQRELSEGKDLLFPIMIDDYVLNNQHLYPNSDLKNNNMSDFCGCEKDMGKYREAFKRLMKGLGKKDI